MKKLVGHSAKQWEPFTTYNAQYQIALGILILHNFAVFSPFAEAHSVSLTLIHYALSSSDNLYQMPPPVRTFAFVTYPCDWWSCQKMSTPSFDGIATEICSICSRSTPEVFFGEKSLAPRKFAGILQTPYLLLLSALTQKISFSSLINT